MTAIAVTIAGSDSGGGAGIQADLKTFSALGVYGASVITALTAQNTKGVTAIHEVPAHFVTAQMDAVLSDLDVGAVKIGMLFNADIIKAVASGLEVLKGFGKPFGAYANGFTNISKDFLKDKSTVQSLSAREDVGPDAYAEIVMGWIGQGATIVGGCCEIGPAHIGEIARRVRADGHTLA